MFGIVESNSSFPIYWFSQRINNFFLINVLPQEYLFMFFVHSTISPSCYRMFTTKYNNTNQNLFQGLKPFLLTPDSNFTISPDCDIKHSPNTCYTIIQQIRLAPQFDITSSSSSSPIISESSDSSSFPSSFPSSFSSSFSSSS